MPMKNVYSIVENLPILLIAVTQNPYLRPMVAEKKQNYRLKSTLKHTQNSIKTLQGETYKVKQKKLCQIF